jgi:hypothetical protein
MGGTTPDTYITQEEVDIYTHRIIHLEHAIEM